MISLTRTGFTVNRSKRSTDFMTSHVLAASLLLSFASAPPLLAQIPSWGVDDFKAPPDPAWRARATTDVEAAYRFMMQNHPGAVPELHDESFVARLETARSVAAERAKTVDSEQGYNAVLAGLAVDMGDKHIWSRPTFVVNLPYWTGAVIGKQGDNWVVVSTDQAAASPPQGARLKSCDGIAAGELAMRNLGGFRATWRIEAQQYQAAPWLLVDEGNPFIRRPDTCIFDAPNGVLSLKLGWKQIKREELIPKLKAAGGGGAAGFGIRKIGGGYWIALQDMSEKGADVAKDVEARQAELRAAPFVVVDVRGNGGGSSDVGTRIAAVLWGVDRARVTADDDDNCSDDLRATPGNVADMEYLMKTLGSTFSPEYSRYLQDQIVSGHKAIAGGRPFVKPPICKVSKAAPLAHVPGLWTIPGVKVVLITDNLCFSACLVLADQFRHLGALHLGQTTDAATRFTQVREQYLPSGYSLFSTSQSVAPGEPADVGPFKPDRTYQGDISNTPTLERWVLEQVSRQS